MKTKQIHQSTTRRQRKKGICLRTLELKRKKLERVYIYECAIGLLAFLHLNSLPSNSTPTISSQ